ncbi:MAG: ribonuclease H family protein [Bacteroidales bacterium]|nr:ribonuclease H family protein [Bacteroidales bacterium]
MKRKYYVVWKGINTGIFDNWADCKSSVEGFQGAKYKSFETVEDATEAFRNGYEQYYRNKAQGGSAVSWQNAEHRPIIPSVSVDAACSGNPGVLEFRGVETATGAEFFKQGPFVEGTVNIGEFLAIAWALALLKKAGSNLPIYSDSKTAIKWIKDKKINTKLMRSPKNEKLFQIVDRALAWLHSNSYPNTIIKWDTEAWGEIPADFGRK